MISKSENDDVQIFQRSALLLFLVVITLAFLWVTRLFLMPVLLAAIVAGLTYPLYLKVYLLFRKRAAPAAVITLLIIAVLTIIPMGILGSIAYHQASSFLKVLDLQGLEADCITYLDTLKERFPLVLNNLDSHTTVKQAGDYFRTGMQHFLKYATSLSLSLLEKVLASFVMLFAMFYFYIEGPRLLSQLIKWSPLKDEYDQILIANFISVTKGTLKASVVIGLINGTLAGLVFWAVGMGTPVFLASLIFIGTFIPVIGGGPVWIPTTIYLLLHGKIGGGIAVLLVCGGLLHAIHSLLLPVLIGQDVKMHNILVLMSTLGGIFVFGFIGVIIGPILGALFVSIWKIYGQVFEREISLNKQTSKDALL